MDLDFLDRVRRTSTVSGVVVSLVVLAYAGPSGAGAFALGCAWTLVNLYVIGILVRLVLFDPKEHVARIAAVMFIKIPALYGIGFLILASGVFPPAALLAGFGWPLAVVFLKATGRLVLGLDGSRRLLSGAGAEFKQRFSRKGWIER